MLNFKLTVAQIETLITGTTEASIVSQIQAIVKENCEEELAFNNAMVLYHADVPNPKISFKAIVKPFHDRITEINEYLEMVLDTDTIAQLQSLTIEIDPI